MIIHQAHNSQGNYSYNAFFYENCEWFYHFHKNYELIYVFSGEVELTLNGRKLLLQAGTFAVVLPNEFHAYHTPDSSYVWIGVFSSDFVSEFAKLTEGKRAVDPRFVCDPIIKSFLLQYLITEEPADLLLVKSLLYAACREFANHVQLQDSEQEEGFIYHIISYVSEHFQEEISLTQIAQTLGYEYHYLSRQFHRHFDMNFKQFLNIYRMDYAQERLLYSDDSVTEIAYAAGFQTVRTFNRVFTEHTGMTPSEFRKNSPRLKRQRRNSDGTFFYSDLP